MKTLNGFSRSLSLFAYATLVTPGVGVARDVVEVNLNAAVREYCHVLRFPSGWQMPRFIRLQDGSSEFFLWDLARGDYEFRVRGLLSTNFLVRGVETKSEYKYYTTNLYEVDLSDPKAIAQPASEEEWNSAAVIAVPRRTFDDYVRTLDRLSKHPAFKGLESMQSGVKKGGLGLSPDQTVVVAQSWSGTYGPSGGSDVPGDVSISLKFGRAHGKLFFDVYRADTLKKLITITASFLIIRPEEALHKTRWITERYFLIPLDERRERCLVCEFGRNRH